MPISRLPISKDLSAEVYIWAATEAEAELLELAGASAAARRAEYRHERAWRQFLASRALLQAVCPTADVQARRLADGRYFSLSHSGDYAALAISESRLGIDLQEFIPKLAALARRYLSAAEWRRFEEMPEAAAARFAALTWASKEALFKAWGQAGVTFATDFELAEYQPEMLPNVIEAKAQNALLASNFKIYLDVLGCNYYLALALEI